MTDVRKGKKYKKFQKNRIETKKKQSIKLLQKLYRAFYYVLVAGFAGVCLYAFLFSSFLAIDDFEVYGTETVDQSKLISLVNSQLEGKYFWIFPKRNFIIFQEGKLEDDILSNFKKIESVKILKKFPNSLSVNIKEREALILWCDKECFILDSSGYAYQKTGLDSQEVKENRLIKIQSGESRDIAEGEKILDQTRMEFLTKARDNFLFRANINIKEEVFIKSRRAEEFLLESEDGWNIFVSTKFPLEKSAETLALLLEKKSSEIDFEKLDYIDLRVEDKAFIKDKEDEECKGEKREDNENCVPNKDDDSMENAEEGEEASAESNTVA